MTQFGVALYHTMKDIKPFLFWSVTLLSFIKFTSGEIEYTHSSGGHVAHHSSIYAVNSNAERSAPVESLVSLYEQASFINYLVIARPERLKSCNLTVNGTTIELDLGSPVAASNSLDVEEFLGHVTSLGGGVCGLKYRNATRLIHRWEWTLNATDFKGEVHAGMFMTSIANQPSYNTKKVVALGNPFSITCGVRYDDEYSYLVNPAGKIIHVNDFLYSRPYLKMDDIGIWQCYHGTEYSMEPLYYPIELVKEADDKVITWVNETARYVNIGCQLNGYNSAFGISFCKITTPTLQVLNVQPYSATDRYHGFGTDYKKAICSMQIEKPLLEIEKGMWQCEIGIPGPPTGAILKVNVTEDINYPKNLQVVTRLGQPLTISCEVPYSSEFCSILAPTGKVYLDNKNFVPRLGRCSVTVSAAAQSDAGMWTCSFAQKMGVPDDKISVEVLIENDIDGYDTIDGQLGGTTELMCRSNGYPLKYCRFTSPLKKTYHIHNHENSTSISYYGRGLEYGDCGIRISNTRESDGGSWLCTIQYTGSSEHDEMSKKMWVTLYSTQKDIQIWY